MKTVPCDQDGDSIKNYFSKFSTEKLQLPKNNTVRLFGNAYATPRYAIPLKTSDSSTQSKGSTEVTIISPSESAVDQAKSEIKKEPRPTKLISQQLPHSINTLHVNTKPHSSGTKGKREEQIVTSSSKKLKKLKKIF
jgi:hypothetical protein